MTITDDIDGVKDATEVAFSIDGTDYTIDLSSKNRKATEKALKPYLDVATKVGKTTSTKRRKTGVSTTGRKTWPTFAVGPKPTASKYQIEAMFPRP